MKTALQEIEAAANAEDRRIAQKRMTRSVTLAAEESVRPSVIFRPALAPDGNQWCALYGANLMEGIAGFGDTPDAAMRDFDKQFQMAKPPETRT